ncbi:MAG TPA: amidohydrolase family protein [Pyrinomonadaceae bacterium]|nr:amidohydrolase family protein [Pyrinomonadaceae bacterium]
MKRTTVIVLLITAILSFCLKGATSRTLAAGKKTLQEPPPVIVLRAARMLDVHTGRLISPAVVIIEKDRIKSVNPATVPRGQLIDLGNVTLLPGFIDMHTHLSFDIEGAWLHRAVTDTAGDNALRGARNARNTLLAGFTTVRDVGAGDFVDVALMRAIDQQFIPGPRIFPAGHSIGITGGHCDTTGYAPGVQEHGPEQGVADGTDGVLKAVRYQIKHGAKVIKICATAGVLSLEGPVGAQQLSETEMRTIVEEATRHGVRVAAHAHGTEGIIAAVRAGVASIEHGSVLNDDAIRLMKERGTYLVPTSYLGQVIRLDALPPPIKAKADYIIPRARESLQLAIKSGVKIAFGTDAAVIPHGQNAKEFGVLVERGMTPIEAIRTATVNAVDLLGVNDRGSIAHGLLADLVAVPGNPLDNIRVLEDVRFVMKGGQVYKRP